MQRKLTLVLVGIALSSILLVGAGVLIFTQVGARDAATEAVEEQLAALQVIASRSDGQALQTIEPAVRRLGAAFDNGQLAVVVVNDSGAIRQLPTRQGGDRQSVAGSQSVTVSNEQLLLLRNGETVIIDQQRNVVGLLRLDMPIRPGLVDGTPALWVRQGVGRVSSQAIRWFVLSATIVLLASVLVGGWLARRFTRPVRSIQHATAAIASGRLDTRITDPGDDELGQLARSVNSMAADLERSRAAEQQFLMSITHDLRTPLTSITGYAEALSDGAVDDPRRAGAIIGSNAERLNRLVGDLLTLAKLETKSFTFHPEPLDLGAVASEQGANARQRITDNGLSIVVEQPPEVEARIVADADRIRQVIDNLIDNAIKFAATTITLHVGATDTDVTLAVVDDGPGIPAVDLPFVFERLYVTQLRPIRAESSSGLGLAIVRELVEGMGGTVVAQRVVTEQAAGERQRPPDEADGGTAIVLTFPRRLGS